jgi:uridine kinase
MADLIPNQSGKIDLILDRLAEYCQHRSKQQVLRIAVDGVDGVGKTTFAHKLGTSLTRTNDPVIKASLDDFHNPRATRYRLGKTSPEGFYWDSYDYAALRTYLLDPLSPGGTGEYCSAVFDHVTDSPLPLHMKIALPGSVLILDGLFLHRPELRNYWDLSIFLDAPFEVTVPRGAARGLGWGSPDPAAPSNRRYIEGQQIYLHGCRPQDQASVVIDYADFSVPLVVAWRLDSQ